MAISHKKLESMHRKISTKAITLSDDNGLFARVSPKGKIAFSFRVYLNGQQIRYKLGSFPEMSLKDAREKCEEDREWVDNGRDPRNRGLLSAGFKALTIGGAVDYWYETYGKLSRKDPDKTISAIKKLLPKQWLSVNCEQMTTIDWSNLYKGIAGNNTGGHGLVCISELRTIMRYCISEGRVIKCDFESLMPSNYCENYKPKERALDPNELGLILNELPDTRLEERNQIVLRLCMVFGCRVNELALAKRIDFDLDERLWSVPKENLKGGAMRRTKITKPLRRPIPVKIIPYIDRLFTLGINKELLLSNRGDIKKPLSSSSLSKISSVLVEDLGMKHWTMHDFRRTIATRLTDIGCPLHISEKLIGHTLRGTMAIYNRSEMLPELDHWLSVWVDKLEQWQNDGENVIDLKLSRA